MPRLYAQNRTSMWADEDFRALSDGAQNLYNYLLAHPSTTYAGVADWFPKRLAHVNTTWTADRVEELGRELAASHHVIIDEDWDEVCIRSFLRWESVLKVPNLARATAHAFEKVESPRLQRVIIHELLRLKEENPEWAAWDIDGFVDILTRRPPLDGKTIDAPINSSDDPPGNPPTDPSPKGSVKGSANPSGKGSPEGSAIPSNQYPLPSTPEPEPSTPLPVAQERDGDENDEFTARAHLKALDLDYPELRKVLFRACQREVEPGLVVRIAVTILQRAEGTVRHPLAYVVESIKTDWVEWQKVIDHEDAA